MSAGARGPETRSGTRVVRGLHGTHGSPIVDLVVRFLVPFMQVFALYVLMHGHYSPGGGFQAGAVLAAAVLSTRIALGHERSRRQFPSLRASYYGVIGVMVYAGTGFVALANGGNYLDYSHLPLWWPSDAMYRSYGILAVEIGVCLAVSGTLVAIFDVLTREEGEA